MPDNLSISIAANTKPAREEIDLLEAKVRSLRKEVRAASDEANRSGGITPRLTESRKELDAAEAQLKSYNREARRTTVTNEEAGKSFSGLSQEVAKFSRAMGVAGGHTKAMRAGIWALIGSEVLRAFNAITEKITEIGQASEKIGVSTKAIQDMQNALGETGRKAADAAGMFAKLTEPFLEERKKAVEDYWAAGREGLDSVKEPTSAYAKALQELGINMSAFGTDTKGLEALDLATKRALVALARSGREAEASRLSVQLLGRTWAEVGDSIEKFVQSADAAKGSSAPGQRLPRHKKRPGGTASRSTSSGLPGRISVRG